MTTVAPAGLDPDDQAGRTPWWSFDDGLVPGRDDLVDALGSVTLSGLALIGLHHVYLGSSYLTVGLAGSLAGILAAFVIGRLRLHLLLAVPFALAVFVLAGGPAVASTAIAGVLPGPGTPGALFSGLVQGWADMLTTAPPMGIADGLGVIPYVCGFVAAGGAMLFARLRPWPLVPVVTPVLVLVVGFLFGTRDVVSTLAQGALFAVVAIGWGAVRANRDRRSGDGHVYWPRLLSGLVMLVIVFAVAWPIGTRLPVVDAAPRTVLRDRFVPPFDPRNEPSPLASFRSYLSNDAAKATAFSVTGLPEGARVRLATMDTYDGVVWVVGGSAAAASGHFERVGAEIVPVPDGRPATVSVTAQADRADVWVPTVGATRAADFAGPRAADLDASFRYNRDTASGAAPVRLRRGDEVTLQAQLAPNRDDKALADAAIDGSQALPALPTLPDNVAKKATELAGAGSPFAQAVKLEEALAKGGFYSDGGPDAKGTARESAPGHSEYRMIDFLGNKRGYIGNAEQFASAMALMARSLGLPARVVMGFAPPPGSGSGALDLHGSDVDAWVEIAFAGHGWVSFYPTPDHKKAPPDIPPKQPQEKDLSQNQPPPPTFLEAPDLKSELSAPHPDPAPPAAEAAVSSETPVAVKAAGALAVPLLAALAVCGLIVGLKSRRRRRRRSRGTEVRRLRGAWDDLCDQARDLGVLIPPGATRREVAALVPHEVWDAWAFADRVDDAMFGIIRPSDGTVKVIWDEADREREAMTSKLSAKDRWKAALSLSSLRPKKMARRARQAERDAATAEARAAAEAEAAEAAALAAMAPRPDDPRLTSAGAPH